MVLTLARPSLGAHLDKRYDQHTTPSDGTHAALSVMVDGRIFGVHQIQ